MGGAGDSGIEQPAGSPSETDREPPGSAGDDGRALRRRSGWIDSLTAALLAVAVGAVGFTAAPAVLRAAGVARPDAPSALSPGGRSAVDRSRAASPRPLVVHDDDDGMLDEPPPVTGKIGLARAPLTLFEQGSDRATVVGHVSEGELVMIVRDSGDWVLVVYASEADIMQGWTRKSGIAIR